jgi:hypothetical protein
MRIPDIWLEDVANCLDCRHIGYGYNPCEYHSHQADRYRELKELREEIF